MGIKGLQRYLASSNTQSLHPYMKYRTKVFAIDSSILLYRFCHAYPHSIGSFLECFVYRIAAFLRTGILPVFVFDGQAPLEKQKAIMRRVSSKNQMRERLERLKSLPQRSTAVAQHIQRLERQCFLVTKGHRTALLRLLEAMGLPILTAEGEAETLCALLQCAGNVDYTLSDDTDTLAYGCTRIVHMFRGSDRYLVETDLDVFLKRKNLTHDEFLNVCVLSGCDYLDRASAVSIETCVEYVRRCHTLDQTLRELTKVMPMHDLAAYERVKDMYLFRTETTTAVMRQHEREHGVIKERLRQYERLDDSGPNRAHLLQLFAAHGLSTFVINRLLATITESAHQFALIRHNFFSKSMSNAPSDRQQDRNGFRLHKTKKKKDRHQEEVDHPEDEREEAHDPQARV